MFVCLFVSVFACLFISFRTGEYTIWAYTEERSSVKVQIEVKEGEAGPRIDLHLVSSDWPL